MEELKATLIVCKNCHAPVETNYCPVCGQQARVTRITFRRVLEEFVEQVVNLDTGFLRTLKNLTFRPGHMMREYIQGKRKPYLKPLQFYLIMLALYFAVNEVLDIDPMEAGKKVSEQINPGQISEDQKKVQVQLMQMLSNNTKVIFSIMVFIQAFSLRLFYRKRNFYYAEMLVISLFLTGYHYIFNLIISLSSLPLGYSSSYWWLTIAVSLLVSGYSAWAILQFFKQRGIGSMLKAWFSVVFTYVLYMLFSGVIGALLGLLLFPEQH